jgi:hypothetical protein
VFKENATQVLERYPPVEGDNRPTMWEMGTPYVFNCPNRLTALALARTVRTRAETLTVCECVCECACVCLHACMCLYVCVVG